MPNLLAHSLLAKRFALKENELNKEFHFDNSFLKGNYDYFLWGAQGPDALFYVGIVPTHGLHIPTALKKIGNKLHKLDGREFFKELINKCYQIEAVDNIDRDQKAFMAFTFGQFAHYLLDREAHPYILYESGFDSDGRITGHYHYDHAFFEANIDACLAKKYNMIDFLNDPSSLIPFNQKSLDMLDHHLVPVLSKMFDTRLPKRCYSNAINNMKSCIHFINKGTRLRIYLTFKSSLSAQRLPKKEDISVLNEERREWLDPVTGKKRHESFLELSNRAFDLLQDCYLDILKYGFNYETFEKYFNNLNYYGTPIGEKWVYHKKQK
jgi:hypothetical protein